MTPENTIDYVEIPAKDLSVARAFFTELFGWKFEDYGPDYCSFHDGRLGGGFIGQMLLSRQKEAAR